MKTLRNSILIILLVLIVGYFLFANSIIKSFAEREMTKAHGAEVNIGFVEHRLFPASITLGEVQVTDPAAPNQNKVQFEQAFAEVELMPLLSSKLIAEELIVDGIAFGQPRTSPGVVLRQPDPNSGFGFPSAEDLPSVDELLANSPLKTTKAVEEAQAVYAEHGETLKQQYEALPSKEQIEQYKAEIEALKNTDYSNPQELLTAKEKFDELKAKILADKQKIDAFRASASAAKADFQNAATLLKNAPAEDYALLQGLIAGDQAALSHVTQSLFGEKAAQYTQYLTLALQTIAPMLSGDASEEPQVVVNLDGLPNVWIKKARASVVFEGESVLSEWHNITDQHSLIDAATTFTIDAAKGSLWELFSTSGQFILDEQGIDAAQQWNIQGVNLDDLPISDSERITAQIVKALLTTTGNLTITDNQLSGTGDINLAQLALTASGNDDFTSAIADAIDDISSLAMQVGFNGDIQNPGFSLRSDLDRQLIGAITTSLTGDQQGKLAELRNKLNAKAADQLGETNMALAQTVDWQALATGDASTLEELLQAELNNVIDDQKNKLFDRLKNRIGG
ncbi:TIGR03545 family protein [Alteromonas sp. ASW11-36]|uniref:TIGR03545 family protein n=1 Tax=Alteromonas arenosi TaxID=3055817 RepID=A0ABT7SZQ6_9ALTE|nr:TIGR03545 family protein [Alteromonas sp. ASW11-36]MDM7861669.1 TIGR03545 family protein [Alteromonas sp. ASW11-36]